MIHSTYLFYRLSSTLTSAKLAKYSSNKASFSKKAASFKLLKGAIEIADSIIVGKSSLERNLIII